MGPLTGDTLSGELGPGEHQRPRGRTKWHSITLSSGARTAGDNGSRHAIQNCPATVTRTASGSTGCSTRSMTPVWHTAAGAVGTPAAGKHIANSESDLRSEP